MKTPLNFGCLNLESERAQRPNEDADAYVRRLTKKNMEKGLDLIRYCAMRKSLPCRGYLEKIKEVILTDAQEDTFKKFFQVPANEPFQEETHAEPYDFEFGEFQGIEIVDDKVKIVVTPPKRIINQ